VRRGEGSEKKKSKEGRPARPPERGTATIPQRIRPKGGEGKPKKRWGGKEKRLEKKKKP